MKSICRILADILYPRLCAVCERSLNIGEKFLCSECVADFPFTENLYYNPLFSEQGESEVNYVKNIYTLFYYNKHSKYKKLIYDIKYSSKKELGIYLGNMLGEKMKGDKNFDMIIPIPLHTKRHKERGFNQAEQIALGISKVLNAPVKTDIVIRTINNRSQTHMAAEERQKNTKNIFHLKNREIIEGQQILLVDDIITTGSTVNACIKTISDVKNIKISVACLGRTL